MFNKVHKPQKGANTGSSSKLINYLDKEKEQSFFSLDSNHVKPIEAEMQLDNNTKALGRDDDKFYMISINPSQEELQKMVGREVKNKEDLTPYEREKLTRELQEYTHDVMDVYAKNFDRKTVKGKEDLLYFGRVETERRHAFNDPEVEQGLKKTDDIKEGLNFHVHVVVGRKSKDGKVKLSPNVQSKGNEWNDGKRTMKRGFNHEEFKIKSQEKFIEKTGINTNEIYIKQEVNKDKILSSVNNKDLKNILTSHKFSNTQQVAQLMEQEGYTSNFSKGIFYFRKGKDVTSIRPKNINAFKTDVTLEDKNSLIDKVDFFELDRNKESYSKNGVFVSESSYTHKDSEKEYKYYTLHDKEKNISINLSALKKHAKEEKKELISSKNIGSVGCADLKNSLNYNVRNVQELRLLMQNKGYISSIESGNVTFGKTNPPLKSESYSISFQHLNKMIEFKGEERRNAFEKYKIDSKDNPTNYHTAIGNINQGEKQVLLKNRLVNSLNINQPKNLVEIRSQNKEYKDYIYKPLESKHSLVIDPNSRNVYSFFNSRSNFEARNIFNTQKGKQRSKESRFAQSKLLNMGTSKLLNMGTSKLKQQLKEQLLNGQLQNEKKMLMQAQKIQSTAEDIAKLFVSPSAAARKIAIDAVRKIIGAGLNAGKGM